MKKWSDLDGGKGNNMCVHNYYAHMLIHLHDIENENGLFEKTMGGGIGTVWGAVSRIFNFTMWDI